MVGLIVDETGEVRGWQGQQFAFAEAVKTPRSAASMSVAVGAHVVLFALLFLLVKDRVPGRLPPLLAEPMKALTDPPRLVMSPNDGGARGGNVMSTAVSQGAPHATVEPLLKPVITPAVDSRLEVAPSVAADVKMDSKLPMGVLSATGKTPSLGILGGDGVGNKGGNHIGVGVGDVGPGVGLLHAGMGGVVSPKVLVSADPEYSDEARRLKFSGNVQVYLWVDEHGMPSHVRVVRGAGMGLDEKAVEAVRQYRFKPATQGGKPVKVDMYVDVNFSIY